MTIITPVIQATRTHDLQSDKSDAHLSTSDGLTPWCRLRRPALRLMARSPRLIANVRRHSSITSTTMPRELLEVPLLQQSQCWLLSTRSGPSMASLNVPGSEV